MNKNQKLDCHTCHKEIPKSAVMTAEGGDYALNFCGKECYERWKIQHKTSTSKVKSTKK